MVLFPIIFILANNLFLFLWKKKHWNNRLKISSRFDKILNNINLGFGIIVIFPFIYFTKSFDKNISGTLIIVILLCVMVFSILIISLKKIIKKLFILYE